MSDWPLHELDKNNHLIDDLGYEVYERGSYGYGCENPTLFDECKSVLMFKWYVQLFFVKVNI